MNAATEPGSPPTVDRVRRRRRLAVVVVILVLAAIGQGVVVVGKTMQPTSVFEVYRLAGRAVLAGENPYAIVTPAGLRFMYPPLFVLVAVPLAALSPFLASIVWYLFALLAYAVAIATAQKLAQPLGGTTTRRVVISFLLTVGYANHNFIQGQASALMVALALLGLLAMEQRRWFVAGAWIGLCAALKPLATIVVLDSLVRREARALVFIGLQTFVFVLAIPALVLGPTEAWAALRSFVEIAGHIQSSGEAPSFLNQSLRAALERGGVSQSAAWQHGISLVLIGVTVITIYIWRPARAISAAMLFCLVPCVAATGWKHHFLVLILPYAALAGAWDHLGVPARVLFVVSAVSSVIRAPEIIGDDASLWLSEVSIALIAALTAWSALVLASRRLAMSDGELSPGPTPSRRRPRQ